MQKSITFKQGRAGGSLNVWVKGALGAKGGEDGWWANDERGRQIDNRHVIIK